MFSNLDVEKSKIENKAVFQISLTNRIFQFVANSYFIFIIPTFTLSYTFQHYSTIKNELFGEFMSNLIALAFAVFFFSYFKNPYRLIKISGESLYKNKDVCKQVFEKMEWKIIVEKIDHVIASPPSIYERQITIIFDQNDILLSAVRFGRWKFIASFHQDNVDNFKEEFIKLKNLLK